MTKILSVTRDSGANVKKLRKLEQDGFIAITDVLVENGRENQKVKRKQLPIAVIGHSKIGEAVIASDTSYYERISEIIGKEHVEDAMHLDAHIRSNRDYFITEDKDFLSKRDELNRLFGCSIATPDELDEIARCIDDS